MIVALGQVIGNLIGNAIKYSPESGSIAIRIAVMDVHTIQLSVQDQGIGIPPERRPSLFERFYYLSGARGWNFGGIGLGLYISRQIIELHGGHLTAEFPGVGGTCFIVSLPRSPIA